MLKGAVSETEKGMQAVGPSARRALLNPCLVRAASCKVLCASCWALSSGLSAW